MQTENPYQAPQTANFDNAAASQELKYAGFWRRVAAFWLDALVVSPLIGLSYLGMQESRLFQLYYLVPGLLFGVFFHVYLVRRYGGTPGKLLMKTRITMVDGSPVTLKAAALRAVVLLVISLLMSIAMSMAVLAMTDEQYFSYGYIARSAKIVEFAPSWYYSVVIALQIWTWGEYITMMFNKRRRSVQDWMGGTVVLHTAATT
jgi:uncharacterized RDD family membrane protein YckC